jgi:hypothetical protein
MERMIYKGAPLIQLYRKGFYTILKKRHLVNTCRKLHKEKYKKPKKATKTSNKNKQKKEKKAN